jgi:5-(aminomethyl)-3-furanmethanol phosphate kinase
MQTIVYKLGGSLLTLDDFVQRLLGVLEQPLPGSEESLASVAPRRLLVVGGGETADIVRRWDQIHGLGDRNAHELAMRTMSLNAGLVAAVLDKARVVADREAAEAAWARNELPVLAAAEFVSAEERRTDDRLPRSWNVTSDSVAAYVTSHWPADTLVLIKSVPAPSDCDAEIAASGGYVDAAFPKLAVATSRIAWVNLRDAEPTIAPWIALRPKG